MERQEGDGDNESSASSEHVDPDTTNPHVFRICVGYSACVSTSLLPNHFESHETSFSFRISGIR